MLRTITPGLLTLLLISGCGTEQPVDATTATAPQVAPPATDVSPGPAKASEPAAATDSTASNSSAWNSDTTRRDTTNATAPGPQSAVGQQQALDLSLPDGLDFSAEPEPATGARGTADGKSFDAQGLFSKGKKNNVAIMVKPSFAEPEAETGSDTPQLPTVDGGSVSVDVATR